VSKIYNPASSKIHPAFTVYNDSDNSSSLYIKVFPKELLYTQANSEGVYKGTIKIDYELLDITDMENTSIADSGSYAYSFKREGVQERYITSIPLEAELGKIYQLTIRAVDIVRKEEQRKYIMVDKRTGLSQQNFILYNEGKTIPYFAPFIVGNGLFKIDSRNFQQYNRIFVSYHGNEMPLPKPTFSLARENEFLSRPDSIWILPFKKDLTYQLKYKGLYFFQLDTNQNEGLTILNFGSDFPKIKMPDQMIGPLAYLTNSVEYKEIEDAVNQKLAVDEFWLDKADNIERARELIRIYYNRVYFANYYFSSFKPGWKTDRGMIYIIYGPPQSINRTVNEEKWVYYRKSFSSSITFTFNYITMPYALNNYILQRSESYDWHWREAVESWKNGKVFLLD
jgi:GWxTD domain-containing protein